MSQISVGFPVVRYRRPFHGFFFSTDATALSEAASRCSLFPAGTATPLARVKDSERVVVTDLTVSASQAPSLVLVYDGADATAADGEVIFAVNLTDNTGGNVAPHAQLSFATPHYCQAGTFPKVSATSAGAVRVCLKGWIEDIIPHELHTVRGVFDGRADADGGPAPMPEPRDVP